MTAAAHAAIDLLRGAAQLPHDAPGASAARTVAAVLEGDLRDRLLAPLLPSDGPSDAEPMSADEMTVLASELLRASLILDPNQAAETWATCMNAHTSVYAKLAVTKALMTLLLPTGKGGSTGSGPLRALLPLVPALRAAFKQTLLSLVRTPPGAANAAPASSPPPPERWGGSRVSNSSKRPFSRGQASTEFSRTTGTGGRDDTGAKLELLRMLLLVWDEDAVLWSHGLSDEAAPLPPPPQIVSGASTQSSTLQGGSKVVFTEPFLHDCAAVDTPLALSWAVAYTVTMRDWSALRLPATAFLAQDTWRTKAGNGARSEAPWTRTRALVGMCTLGTFAQRLLRAPTPSEAKVVLASLWTCVRGLSHLARTSPATPMPGSEHALAALHVAEAGWTLSLLDAALLMALSQPDPDVCQDAMALGEALTQRIDHPFPIGGLVDLAGERSGHWAHLYDDLVASSAVYVGRVAQQRRIRAALRAIPVADPATQRAWSEAHRRWTALTRVVVRPEVDASDDKVTYWHNLGGLLASLGGACTVGGDLALTDSFLHTAVDLLGSESLLIREKIKETLSTDLSPRLSAQLATHIHTAIALVFTASTDGLPLVVPSNTRLVEHSVAVLLALAARVVAEATAPAPDAPLVDLGPLLVLCAEYATALVPDDRAMRVRTSLACLARTVLAHPDLLLLSHAARVKNHLLHALVTWSTDDPVDQSGSSLRLARELSRVALPAAAELAYGLALRPDDASLRLGDTARQGRTRVYAQLLRALLPLARRACLPLHDAASVAGALPGAMADRSERMADRPLADAAIACLARVGAANADAALTLLVPLTYDRDVPSRAAAMQILAGVLEQGGEFALPVSEEPGAAAGSERNGVASLTAVRAQMMDLLVGGGMQLALAVAQTPRAPDAEPVDRMLLSVLSGRGKAVAFLCLALREEVDATTAEDMVLRSNSFRIRILSLYARMHGYTYLRSLLGPLLVDVENLTRTAGADACEMDPSRLLPGLGEEPARALAVRQARLETMAQTFIDTICHSAARIPSDLRALAAQIRALMLDRFPHAVHQGVGGFIFLRFISPMIVAPQLVDLTLDPALEVGTRRTLLFVSKILQTLASNNLFGGHKEPHMTVFNAFLKRNVWKVTNFLDQVANAPLPSPESGSISKGSDAGESALALASLGYPDPDAWLDQAAVHRYLWENSEKLGTELALRASELHTRGRRAQAEQTGAIYPHLLALLQRAGAPGPPGKEALAPFVSQPELAQEAYQDLIVRRSRMPLPAADKALLRSILRVGPDSRAGRPVVYYTAALVPAGEVDLTALMAHACSLLEPLTEGQGAYPSSGSFGGHNTDLGFDLVLDFTASGPHNFLPYSALLYFALIAPPALGAAVRTVLIVNMPHTLREAAQLLWPPDANSMAGQSGGRHHASPAPGSLDAIQALLAQASVHACTTLSEVEAFISPRHLALWEATRTVLYPPPKTSSAASLPLTTSRARATLVRPTGAHVPVTLRAAGAFLCIEDTKPQEVIPQIRGVCAEVVPLDELSDIRSVGPAVSDPTQTAFLLTFRAPLSPWLLHSSDYAAVVDIVASVRAAGGNGGVQPPPVPVPTMDLTSLPLVGPGVALNAALLNLTADSYPLRMGSYALLAALTSSPALLAPSSRSRDEDSQIAAKGKLFSVPRLALPARAAGLAVEVSRDFAASAPPAVTLAVTFTFAQGVALAPEAVGSGQQAAALQYLAPWLSNLPGLLRCANPRRAAHVKLIQHFFSSLLMLAVKRDELFVLMQRWVWMHVNKMDELLPIFLDVAVERAVTLGVHTAVAERIIDSLSAFSSANIRGKLLARLRIAVTHVGTALGTPNAIDSPAGSGVAVLLRMLMVLSFTSRWEAMMFFPETLHVCLLLVGTGPEKLRATVQGCVLNLLHSLCTDDGAARGEKLVNPPPSQVEALRQELEFFNSDEALGLFGLPRHGARAFELDGTGDPAPTEPLGPTQLATLAERLYALPDLAAPSIDTANAWRARLTSLVTAAAFQFNPYLQTRAFVLLGGLSQGEIDDDLVYQVQVSLRGALAEWAHHGTEEMLISLILCLSRMAHHLPRTSASIPQLFWIAIAMLQVGRVAIFRVALDLLASVLAVLDEARHAPPLTDAMGLPAFSLQSLPLHTYLLRERQPFGQAACRLDDACGIDFGAHFGFALATLLVKGLREAKAAEQTKELLYTLLRMSSEDEAKLAAEVDDIETRGGAPSGASRTHVQSSSVAYFIALLSDATTERGLSKLLAAAGLSSVAPFLLAREGALHLSAPPDMRVTDLSPLLGDLDNKTVLLVVALLVVLIETAEGEKEGLILYTFLARLTELKPAIVSIVYDRLTSGIEHVLSAGRDVQLISAVERIMAVALREPVFVAQIAETGRRGGAMAYFVESGFIGLLTCGTFASSSQATSAAAAAAAIGTHIPLASDQPTPEQQRLHWAALASDLMVDLIDTSTGSP